MSEPTILPQYRSANASEEPAVASKPDEVADILLRLTGSLPSQNYAVSLAYGQICGHVAKCEQEAYKKGYIDGGIETLNGRVEFAKLEREEQ